MKKQRKAIRTPAMGVPSRKAMTIDEADQQRLIIGNWQRLMNIELDRLGWPLHVVFQPSREWSLIAIHAAELVKPGQPPEKPEPQK